jgi:hypothetical protein
VELFLIAFLVFAALVLCGLCLFVIEYQNGRTRRLNQVWSDRMRTLAEQTASSVPKGDPKAA